MVIEGWFVSDDQVLAISRGLLQDSVGVEKGCNNAGDFFVWISALESIHGLRGTLRARGLLDPFDDLTRGQLLSVSRKGRDKARQRQPFGLSLHGDSIHS